jgi:hypothetical protein
MSNAEPHQLEVQFKPESGKAVIEGKTAVPFQSFVQLILQRKVQNMFKEHGKEPVIVGSDLLTRLASAPQDSQKAQGNLVLVSLGLGAVVGVAAYAAVQAVLILTQRPMDLVQHLIVLGCILGLVILGAILMQLQRMPRGEKLTETVEGIAQFLGK